MGKCYFSDSACKDHRDSVVFGSTIEIVFSAVTAVIVIWPFDIDFLLLNAAHNETILYNPIAAGWVYLFTINKGIIAKLFSNRIFYFLRKY